MSTGPALFPIFSIVKLARKRVFLEFSALVERYWWLLNETIGTYTPDAAEKLKLTCNINSLLIPFERFNFDILTLRLYIQSTLGISKSKGPSETLRDIRTSTYQIFRFAEIEEIPIEQPNFTNEHVI